MTILPTHSNHDRPASAVDAARRPDPGGRAARPRRVPSDAQGLLLQWLVQDLPSLPPEYIRAGVREWEHAVRLHAAHGEWAGPATVTRNSLTGTVTAIRDRAQARGGPVAADERSGRLTVLNG